MIPFDIVMKIIRKFYRCFAVFNFCSVILKSDPLFPTEAITHK